jgi:glycosyltransferase involved in cell wall biosynthesis
MSPIPLLILSDAPTAGSGLARITRDLATRIHANLPEFRVGTAGYGGPYSSRLGFPQYNLELQDWVCLNLEEIWEDFAGDEKGALLTIWDATRVLWLSRPENCTYPRLRKWLTTRPFSLYGYFPIDATGPHDKLTGILAHTISAYDRILAYSSWAEGILKRTFAGTTFLDRISWLPHGIDSSVFYPRERHAARHNFGERNRLKTPKGKWFNIPDDVFLIGIVATNQTRKDWGLGIQTVAELAKERNVIVWCHTDVPERHWSIPALINDFGLADKAVITTLEFTDEQMAWNYSACDVTLGIGLGEGYGYPIFESLACGTPCVHGNCGGAPEHMPESCLVWPNDSPIEIPIRLEGPYNCYRQVHDPKDWAHVVSRLQRTGEPLIPVKLSWDNLWPRWAEWLKAGV